MTVTLAERQRLIEAMDIIVAHTGKISYQERRPILSAHISTLVGLRRWFDVAAPHSIKMDCSEAAQLVFHAAGLKNPSGTAWTEGNTVLMEKHLPKFKSLDAAKIGSIIILHDPDHVVIVRRPAGADPEVFSLGTSRAQILKLSDEQKYHKGPTVYLSINSLG